MRIAIQQPAICDPALNRFGAFGDPRVGVGLSLNELWIPCRVSQGVLRISSNMGLLSPTLSPTTGLDTIYPPVVVPDFVILATRQTGTRYAVAGGVRGR